MRDQISVERISYLCYLCSSIFFLSLGTLFILYNYFILALNRRK